ncbi:MAG TPA: toll/interleukin-1 receptor domain-containing protein, partial [Nitrospira sp.]|nr:toll/interleukin-1 receptor domain-containing protein [Nitrospira sp.]
VWCDRFQMLGGESFPRVIDQAIKTRTFRLIALLSRHSLAKPNPLKERTLALAISRKRQIDFMIPLNVDGLTPDELTWDYSDLTYLPFQDWSAGLEMLLKKLRSINAPRPLSVEQGRQIVAETFLPQHVLLEQEETLYSNCFSFERIPESLHIVDWTGASPLRLLDQFPEVWPRYDVADKRIVSFSKPPEHIPKKRYQIVEVRKWREQNVIEGVPVLNLVSNLLKQALLGTLLERHLRRDPATGLIYFPKGSFPKNKIKYQNRKGRKAWIAVVGEKKFRGRPYRYHLAPDFQIRQDLGPEFVAQLKIRLFLTDLKNKPLPATVAIPRRKHASSGWFNQQWLNRVWAIASFLARNRTTITLLVREDPIVLRATPISGPVGFSIAETELKELRTEIEAHAIDWTEEEDEETE